MVSLTLGKDTHNFVLFNFKPAHNLALCRPVYPYRIIWEIICIVRIMAETKIIGGFFSALFFAIFLLRSSVYFVLFSNIFQTLCCPLTSSIFCCRNWWSICTRNYNLSSSRVLTKQWKEMLWGSVCKCFEVQSI